MSYKHRLQYTSLGQRRRELRSLAQKYLEKEASRCEEFALYTKKELRRYISRFLKKIHKQLSGLRGALLLSLLILYHCAGSPNPVPPPMDDPPISGPPVPEPEPKRIFVANFGQVNKVYQSDGMGGLTVSDISPDTNNSRSIAVDDLNGDGYLDVVVANSNQINRVYLADGEGGFTAGTNIFSDTNDSQSIAVGDLNGDGHLDIVVANYNQINRVYLGDGSGDFTGVSGSDISTDTNKSRSIAVDDLNGDGHLDIVVANYSQRNRVYLGDGSGDFTGVSGTDISSDADRSLSIALGDLNGDDDLDIVVANYGVNKVYLGDGSGDFTGVSGTDISSDADRSLSIALGDLNGDDDLDIVVANYFTTETDKVYLGDGSGDFTGVSGSDISSDMHFGASIAVGDLDGDGDLDIAVATQHDQSSSYTYVNRFYYNDGSGGFTGVNISDREDNSRSVVIK